MKLTHAAVENFTITDGEFALVHDGTNSFKVVSVAIGDCCAAVPGVASQIMYGQPHVFVYFEEYGYATWVAESLLEPITDTAN